MQEFSYLILFPFEKKVLSKHPGVDPIDFASSSSSITRRNDSFCLIAPHEGGSGYRIIGRIIKILLASEPHYFFLDKNNKFHYIQPSFKYETF